MRNITFSLAFLLLLNFPALAQSNKDLICPTVSVLGPASIVMPNDLATYTASVDTKGKDLKLEYNWLVNKGEIIDGQNTLKLTIKQPENQLTVTIKVVGFPDNCPNTASETMIYDPIPMAQKIVEFSGTNIGIGAIQKVIQAVKNNPSAQLYIFNKVNRNSSEKVINKRRKDIAKNLLKAGIDAEQITFVKTFGELYFVEFWLVPSGADIPKPE